jgi:amidase
MPTPETVTHVAKTHWSRNFDATLPPAVLAQPGSRLVVETHCCSMGTVTRNVRAEPDDFYAQLGYTPGMPITGPIAVEGAQVGDIIGVEILRLDVADAGWTMVGPGRGAFGHRLDATESRVISIVDGQARFSERVSLPVRPMIGCIGTTPVGDPLRAGWPGEHGGNMDCKLIEAGATIFLPVLVPGANLALGDLHAVMGDGEVGVAGLEIGGEVELRVRLYRGLPAAVPLLETPTLLATIYSAEDLDAAAGGATERMADFLTHHAGLPLAEAAMLLSLAGDLRICQIVDPLMTCRMELSKSVLTQLGIDVPALWKQWEVGAD